MLGLCLFFRIWAWNYADHMHIFKYHKYEARYGQFTYFFWGQNHEQSIFLQIKIGPYLPSYLWYCKYLYILTFLIFTRLGWEKKFDLKIYNDFNLSLIISNNYSSSRHITKWDSKHSWSASITIKFSLEMYLDLNYILYIYCI